MAKFIVVDGLDGCGKATQVARISDLLKDNGYNVVKMDFPNYDSNSSAAVKMYLNGELGENPNELNPYMCASFYAVDRFINFYTKYQKYFSEDNNTIILADRYLSANIIYQGAKINDAVERHKLVKWEYDYECGLCGLPKEDMTILLTIPPVASQALMSKRYNGDESKKDIHEVNVDYLEKCYDVLRDTYSYINESKIANWKWIDCYDYNKESIKTVEDISNAIIETISNLINT